MNFKSHRFIKTELRGFTKKCKWKNKTKQNQSDCLKN